jgi:hypothetical protein
MDKNNINKVIVCGIVGGFMANEGYGLILTFIVCFAISIVMDNNAIDDKVVDKDEK